MVAFQDGAIHMLPQKLVLEQNLGVLPPPLGPSLKLPLNMMQLGKQVSTGERIGQHMGMGATVRHSSPQCNILENSTII